MNLSFLLTEHLLDHHGPSLQPLLHVHLPTMPNPWPILLRAINDNEGSLSDIPSLQICQISRSNIHGFEQNVVCHDANGSCSCGFEELGLDKNEEIEGTE